MKIAVISDIHENYHNLLLFLDRIKGEGIGHILFLGDFINAGIARVLARSGYPVFAVWGNNDGDRTAILTECLHKESGMKISKECYGDITIENRRIFLSHYPDLVQIASSSGLFDAVFFGHSHQEFLDSSETCVVMNPGEISAHKFGNASFGIYDTASNSAVLYQLDNSMTVKNERVEKEYFRLGFNQE